MTLSRDLSLPWQSHAMQDVLQSLLLAELVSPSSELWLLSAWVSDMEVIDNRARAFSGIRPDWPSSRIRLSKIIEALVICGTEVCVVMRDVDYNSPFHWVLKEIQRSIPQKHSMPGKLGIAVGETAHEKSIVGEDFIFGGSMNLTKTGMTSNDEHMLLRVDSTVAAHRRLDLRRHWGKALEWQ